jgi:Holliday junction resolvase RusA-like endonuclease
LIKFEFTVDGTPVSQQTRRRERLREWKITVRREAEKYWSSDQTMATGAVMLQITYFYNTVAMDVDNIVKPIQDAIIGLAYVDDNQVTDILVRKRYLLTKFKTKGITPTLQEGFDRRNEFLYIVVTEAPDQEVIM